MNTTKEHYNIYCNSCRESRISDYKYCTRPTKMQSQSKSLYKNAYDVSLQWLAFIGGTSKQPILKDRKRAIYAISDYDIR